jgi:hypothetical protein
LSGGTLSPFGRGFQLVVGPSGKFVETGILSIRSEPEFPMSPVTAARDSAQEPGQVQIKNANAYLPGDQLGRLRWIYNMIRPSNSEQWFFHLNLDLSFSPSCDHQQDLVGKRGCIL